MVHLIALIPELKVFGKVENTYLVEVFPPAGDVALIFFVTLRGKTHFSKIPVKPGINQKNFPNT